MALALRSNILLFNLESEQELEVLTQTASRLRKRSLRPLRRRLGRRQRAAKLLAAALVERRDLYPAVLKVEDLLAVGRELRVRLEARSRGELARDGRLARQLVERIEVDVDLADRARSRSRPSWTLTSRARRWRSSSRAGS